MNEGTKRIHLEQLPGYALELNPTEWVWSNPEFTDLANIACDKFFEPTILMQISKKRLHNP